MSDSSESERFSEGWDEHARKAFALMDPKDDSHILGSRLEYYFQIIGENPTKAEVCAALSAIGKTLEDEITFDQCVAALKAYVQATTNSRALLSSDDVVRVVGRSLDPNNTGKISKEALTRLLSDEHAVPPHERLDREEMDQILAELKITDGKTIQSADFFSLLLDI
jgi:Ca2+-binding EF-hand superfamily protein